MKRALAISLFAVAACTSTTPGDDHGWGDGLGDPDNPVPQSAEDGPYATRTMMDFTVEQILPPQAHLVVVTLRAFADNPARTLITVADQQGVPALEQLYAVIPGVLKDRFEGWVNDAIGKLRINGMTVPQYAGQVAMLAETALTKFEIDSTLAILPGKATHTLTAIDLTPAGIPVRVPISGLAADILTQHPTITVAQGGAFSVGDQTFGLAIGEYAWQGLNAGVANIFGGDIQTSLDSAVNCPAIATEIASKCVLGVCVGHEMLIGDICQSSLDLIVDQMHARFAALDLNVFRFLSGDARLVDEDLDGIADKIVEGRWDGELNMGLGLRKAPATWTAAR